MHVVSREPFDVAARRFPNASRAIDDLYRVLKRSRYTSPEEMRQVFTSLDRMKYREKWWVIDIAGHQIRAIFFADFERGKVFIKHIVSHADYSKLIRSYREDPE